MTEALADTTVKQLRFDGDKLTADVATAITAADVDRTIEGASTLTLTVRDAKRKLLRSGLFSSRLTTQVDAYAFELVEIRKAGDDLTLTFEDLAVAALRKHTDPRKVAAGTMTRINFARLLVGEEPWLQLATWDALGSVAKVELARGKVESGDTEPPEDSWAALGRLADEVGWRRWCNGRFVYFISEGFMFLADPLATLEEGKAGVDWIDFDWDAGKPVATATVQARADRWTFPPASVVQIVNNGPADGKWLVGSIKRSLFSTAVTVTLTQPRPTLPEPDPPPAPSAAELGPEGSTGPVEPAPGGAAPPAETGSSGDEGTPNPSTGYAWPARGPITSGFGKRDGKLHAGIDIGVPIGTPVTATAAGTVAFAGQASGYGNAVYIKHGNVISRYGHLSKIQCRRGQQVNQGDRIASSGNTGHSTGPHLHFEIRPGDVPKDPMTFLRGRTKGAM